MLKITVAASLAALCVAGQAAAATGPALAPPIPGGAAVDHRSIAGLKAPGRIVVDHWGIAHVYGANAHDAFFLQGYNAARDRLWQIDLWRKRGLGRLSASFGPAFVDQDKAARLFLYRGDMKAEWASYPAEAHGWTEAFVAGVNAYVAEVRVGKRALPREFQLTGSMPETWDADDVVRIRSHALVSNLTAEVARARSLCAGGLKYEPLRRTLEPPHTLTAPDGLDPCLVTPGVLKNYILATALPTFDGKKMVAETPRQMELAEAENLAEADRQMATEGSNNWVIAGSHTTTGRPILANDPHRDHRVPSLRYVVQVDAPDIHLIGAGEPALPGISIGHNDDAAWGMTIFPVDQQDLYVYRLSPDHPDAYLYKGAWEPMKVVHETLQVKGEADRDIALRFTRHGGVIDMDTAKGAAFAVRSVWDAPGASGYFNAAWMFRGKTWSDFVATHDRWGAPALNLVYADRSGAIGWLPSAFVPLRPNWDGLTPAPGDGRYEWNGFLKPSELPVEHNPARGWIATANEMNLPAGYPNEKNKISFEWTDRSRIDRIDTVLASKPKLSILDSEKLQTDQHSPLAVRTIALLAGLTGDDPDQAAALKLLQSWDGNETVDSAPAALFELWTTRHLREAVVARFVPESARAAFADAQIASIATVLSQPGGLTGDAAARAEVLKTSLGAAYKELRGLLGPDAAQWRWGSLHHANFAPATAAIADPIFKTELSLGSLQIGGSGSTPMATSYRPSDFSVVSGASVRMVMDVGAWDNSVVINTPGQSGDPYNAHYRDLYPIWAAGNYVPLLYSREAVMKNAETVMEFAPAGR